MHAQGIGQYVYIMMWWGEKGCEPGKRGGGRSTGDRRRKGRKWEKYETVSQQYFAIEKTQGTTI